MYYNQAIDGVLHYALAKCASMEATGASASANNYGLNSFTALNWNDFSYTPFALGISLGANATITANGPLSFCQGNTVTLSANTGACVFMVNWWNTSQS